MADVVVRPSSKIIMVGYVLALGLTIAGATTAYVLSAGQPLWWLGAIPGVLCLIALVWRHLRLRMEKLTFSDDHLYHEVGFISKSTRTINLSKVQDVTVLQGVKQRLFGIGRISVETSGGSSAIVVDNVDNPHKIADMILERSRHNPPPQ